MIKRLNTVWLPLFYATLLTIFLCWPAAQKCDHCRKPAIWEAILAHITGDATSILWFESKPVGFLHTGCAKAWMDAHPLELDEEGRIISVYDPRHSSNQ